MLHQTRRRGASNLASGKNAAATVSSAAFVVPWRVSAAVIDRGPGAAARHRSRQTQPRWSSPHAFTSSRARSTTRHIAHAAAER